MSLPAESVQSSLLVSPEEYLHRERAADFRSEYVGGRMVAMSGASWTHNRIASNLGGQLYAQLRGGGCQVVVADMKVRLTGTFRYVYPDLVVVCGEPEFQDERTDIVTNPTLIVEVLSDSTEAADRGEKWNGYRQLPSLREYVLVSQTRPAVERYSRQGDLWIYSVAEGLIESITFEIPDVTLALADIYEDVAFAES